MLNLLRRLTQSAARKTLAGVDVASFQGPPGTWVSEAGSISWAAVKITELQPGDVQYVNPDASADWQWLLDNNKGRIGYLFAHPSVSAADTVDYFISQINGLGLRDDDAVALDLEVSDGLDPAQVAAWAVDVQSRLEARLGRKPLLYTFRDFAAEGYCAGLGGYPLWIADPSDPAGHPQVPAPWKTWAIHQYDISGAIDRDVANYASQAAMSAALGKVKEPDLQNLGGTLVSALASGRWEAGQTVVAGLGQDGYIQANLWDGKAWSGWKNVSPTKASGAPAVIVWPEGFGHLYYVDESSACIQLDTTNYGATWT
ncbi:MAG TPA: GH25 family lysozyme [Streptosporangiaceae bacterium]|nr:GH25 family lysozyme [Streptosporangiaceae bacterium]